MAYNLYHINYTTQSNVGDCTNSSINSMFNNYVYGWLVRSIGHLAELTLYFHRLWKS